MRKMFANWGKKVLVAIFPYIYRLYGSLWRLEEVRKPTLPAGKNCLYAHWHGDELLLVPRFAHRNMSVMVSTSRDGELMKRILSKMGFTVVRGSSTRGGVGGLKALIDAVMVGGHDASLAVDGPRGPLYHVKPGILKLAQQTGAPLIPGAAAASKRFIFKKAWNQCYFPLPFSHCVIVYGEPMTVPADLTSEQFEELRVRLETKLLALKAEAESTYRREFHPAPKAVLASATLGV
jgi:lysophospholipid acyltransferase (LPLAT)-like uncharacterized protein